MEPIFHHINILLFCLFSYLLRLFEQFVTINKSKSFQNPKNGCANTNHEIYLHEEDAQLVIDSLGLSTSSDELIASDILLQGTYVLLEEKEFSLDELKAAFEVFDANRDGFIGPTELRDLMGKFGIENGMKIEDCEMMIRVYDKDGDGAINLQEFRNMLEKAT